MHRVKISGAGQLGSRHLQALQAIQTPLEIHVIDPSPQSLDVARERFEAVSQGAAHIARFAQQAQPTETTDVAIVATSASVRRKAIEELLRSSDIKYLVLEKLLFDEPEDYPAVADLLKEKGVQTWVNCPMRVMPVYQDIKRRLANKPISYRVTGSQFGLVTNSIHYLDHVCDLIGCDEFVLDTSALIKAPIASKRSGFLELNGTMTAQFADGSRCEISCYSEGNAPVVVEIFSETDRFIVRESDGIFWSSSAASNWVWKEEQCSIPYQSQITTGMVQSLLEDGTCGFTPYEVASRMHLALLEPLHKFLGKKTGFASFPFT